MKSKLHLKIKKRIKLSKIDTIIVIIIFLIFAVYLSIKKIGKEIEPYLMSYGEIEAKKLATVVVSKSLTKKQLDELNINDLFKITKKDNNKIETIQFDSIVVNKILLNVSTNIQRNLKYIEKGEIDKLTFEDEIFNEFDNKKLGRGIFYEVPIGTALNNPLFSNIGPKIPIKFSLIGNISSSLENNVRSYGINNTMIEVKIKLKLVEKIILPFKSKEVEVTNEVPLIIKMIQGEIPPNFYGTQNSSETLTIPVE
ncbi:MAG: sporulation protein YunB [Bacilli bacterium]